MDFDPIEFARQLTLFDHKLLRLMSLDELLLKHYENPHTSPLITEISEHVNRVCILKNSEIIRLIFMQMTTRMATDICTFSTPQVSKMISLYIEASEVEISPTALTRPP